MKKFAKRSLALMLAVVICVCPMLMLAASAQELDYQAKKAAYREKILADDVTTDDFLIGSWVSFYPFDIDSYEYQLDQMAEAGINFNIFPKGIWTSANSAEEWNDVETQYAKRNMVYMMYGGMSANIEPSVALAAGKEHCIGYHVKDEPTGDELAAVAEQIKAYRIADPDRYPFVNLFPSYANERLGEGLTYRDHVEKYMELVGAENIEYLSHDYYPFGDGSTDILIFADLEVIRSVAYDNGKLMTHAFPQSTSWIYHRMPNIDEMRWNVYAYLAYGFKGLSWYNMVHHSQTDDGYVSLIMYHNGKIADQELFDAWSELNWEVRGLSSALMQLDTVHAYHVMQTIEGVEYLPEDHFLKPVGTNNFIVSEMENKDGTMEHIMIYNRNFMSAKSCEFDIDPASKIVGVEYFDPNIGEYIAIDISDGKLKDDFKVGEGKLYRLTYGEPTTPEPTVEPDGNTNDNGVLIWVIVGAVVAVAAVAAVIVIVKKNK